jgi:hypothetical protein
MIGKKNLLRTGSETEGMTKISGVCVFTNEWYECEIPTNGLESWLNGQPIQTAMPDVSLDVREFLISGISPTGWEQTFSK